MVNKGAQAMTLIAVHELRERFPYHNIYVHSPVDMANKKLDKKIFTFKFTGWYPLKFARCQHHPFQRSMILLRSGSELSEAEAIYRNTDFIVDVSGYALGSNWSDKICNDFLDILEFAQGFGIPVYVMPQSFGPFDFGETRKALDTRIRKLLPTAKIIFAREQEGYDALVNNYGLKNVSLAHDLVLSSTGIDLANVFVSAPNFDLPEIRPNSVAVVPNSMNSNVSSQDTILSIYTEVINTLLKRSRTVYLISHSAMDAALCRELKKAFNVNGDVVLLDRDFTCLEFNEIVKKFSYLVASRFHSIVHAFKNGIPCIALGWATKYHDLLTIFDQEQYVLDVRDEIGTASIFTVIERMDSAYQEESGKIQNMLASVQKQNVFDVISQHPKELP